MTTTSRLVTADELLNMPNSQRRELVKGELRIMAPAGFDHGAVEFTLGWLLSGFVRTHQLGTIVGGETGFRLSRDPDTVRAADVAFVRAARIPEPRPKGFWEGAPDLAVEVVSPTDTLEEVEEKVDEYLAAGTPLVWVVNPKRRTITVHRPGENPQILRDRDVLTAPEILAGFRCTVAEVFA